MSIRDDQNYYGGGIDPDGIIEAEFKRRQESDPRLQKHEDYFPLHAPADNSAANFSVGVDEVPQGFSCRLISPDGAIFMEREFRSRHEAESHRDRLIEAWNGGLNHRHTRVLKLVEDELQKP